MKSLTFFSEAWSKAVQGKTKYLLKISPESCSDSSWGEGNHTLLCLLDRVEGIWGHFRQPQKKEKSILYKDLS